MLDLIVVSTKEWWLPTQDEESDNSTWPKVASFVVNLALHHLWCDEVNGTAVGWQINDHLFSSTNLVDAFGHSKVDQLYFDVVNITTFMAYDYNVVKFEISVCYTLFLNVPYG